MRSPVLIVAAIVVVSVTVALIGEALALGSVAYLAALVIGSVAVSLIDPDRFWGADLLREAARRRDKRSRRRGCAVFAACSRCHRHPALASPVRCAIRPMT